MAGAEVPHEPAGSTALEPSATTAPPPQAGAHAPPPQAGPQDAWVAPNSKSGKIHWKVAEGPEGFVARCGRRLSQNAHTGDDPRRAEILPFPWCAKCSAARDLDAR